jgi:hypothetical protein
MPLYEDEIPFDEPEPEAAQPAQPVKTRARRGQKANNKPASGEVNVLLNAATNEFEIMSDEDLLAEASNILKNPSMQVVKGKFFAPEITFKPVE